MRTGKLIKLSMYKLGPMPDDLLNKRSPWSGILAGDILSASTPRAKWGFIGLEDKPSSCKVGACNLLLKKIINLWLCWVPLLLHGAFSSCSEQELLSHCGAGASHCTWLLFLQSTGCRMLGFQKLWHAGLVDLQHVGSSRSRNRTHVPCTGRWTLCH